MLLALCLETRTLASWWGILLWKWDCFSSVVHLFRKDLILIVLSRTTYSSMKQETLSSQISGIRLWMLEHHFLPKSRCKLVDTYKSTFRQKLIHWLTMGLPQVSLCTRERPGSEMHCLGNVPSHPQRKLIASPFSRLLLFNSDVISGSHFLAWTILSLSTLVFVSVTVMLWHEKVYEAKLTEVTFDPARKTENSQEKTKVIFNS